jgi:hypothetical protein
LREGEAEADHGRAAHGAPEVEVAVVVAGREEVVAGRAEASDDHQIAAVLHQLAHHLAAVEPHRRRAHFATHFLRPSMRCENNTASRCSPSKASAAAASTVSAASSDARPA